MTLTKSQFGSRDKGANGPYYDKDRLKTLQFLLGVRLDELLDKLEVNLRRGHKAFFGPCPIHGGNKPNALQLYHGGDFPGKWVCLTRHCEDTFKGSILGFVRGVLSARRTNWAGKHSKQVGFQEAVDWCCEFLGQKLEDLEVDRAELEKRRFVSDVGVLTQSAAETGLKLKRADVRARLIIPSPYFVSRGYSPEVLDTYDVGDCLNPAKPMFGRAVVPVYDAGGLHCLGFAARSVHEACGKCGCFHHPNKPCPAKENEDAFTKWRNSSFPVESTLYNYWSAEKVVRSTWVAVLVEGKGCVWRLEEAGIHCGLGLFGARLCDPQQFLLERSGATTLVVLTDMDTAGRECAARIKRDLGKFFRVLTPDLPKHDIGSMPPDDVRRLVCPILDKWSSK